MTSAPIAGPFALSRPLARGGMAEVWAATHRATGEAVALKLVPSGREELTTALAREVRAVARLDHPHVVWIHDHGLVDPALSAALAGAVPEGSPWFAMELCAEGTLKDHVVGRPWPALRKHLVDLLDALAHAHARGLVHRDLKPANVLFRAAQGRPPLLKLTDFGLAHPTGGPELPTRAGTFAYMAPEQFTEADQGPWTDLYAIGCLAWWMTTGRTPFREGTPIAWARAHAFSPPPAFAPTVAVPEGLEGWLRRALAKDPGERFRRAADAAHALAELDLRRSTAAHPAPERPPSEVPTLLLPSDPGTGPTLVAASEPTSFALPDASFAPEGSADVRREVPPMPSDWRVLQLVPRAAHLAGAGLGLFGLRTLPLVGRHEERDALWAVAREVEAADAARLVVLEGPVGAGKSRLASWFLERLHETGAAEVHRADHQPERGPLDGLRGLCARALRATHAAPELLARRARELLDPPTADRILDVIAGREGERPGRRFAAVLALLERLAGGRITALWLDDLQWGPESVELARWLLARGRKVVVVATWRPDAGLPSGVDALLSAPGARRLPLGPLNARARAELLRTMLGLDPTLAATVDQRSAGSPLLAVQLVTSLVERGALVQGPSGFRLAGEGLVPASLGDAWEARLAPVWDGDERARHGVELGATLGRVVDRDEWAAACARAGLPSPEPLVERLAARQLVEVEDRRVTFVHGLLREALLEGARAAGRLPRWHTACAEALGPDAPPDRRGLHLLAAGRPEEALPLLERASVLADRLGEFARNLYLRTRIAEALRAVAPDEDPRHGFARLGEALALRNLGRLAEAHAAVEEALASATLHGQPVLQVRALEKLSMNLAELGRPEEAAEAAERAFAIALLHAGPDEQASAANRAASAWGRLGRPDTAEAWIDRALQVAPPDAMSRATALLFKMTARRLRGDPEGALAPGLEGRAIAEAQGSTMVVADFDRVLGDLYAERGDFAEAERRLSACRAAYERSESTLLPLVVLTQALLARRRSRPEEAELLMREALVAAEASGRVAWVLRAVGVWIPLAGERGDWDRFARLLDMLEERLGAEKSGALVASLVEGAEHAARAGQLELARRAMVPAERLFAVCTEVIPGLAEQLEGVRRRLG